MNAVIVLGGDSLEINDVVEVARHNATVRLDDAARERIRSGRETLERALERGDIIYGVTTGAGAHKRIHVDLEQSSRFETLMLESQRTGNGPMMPPGVVFASRAI